MASRVGIGRFAWLGVGAVAGAALTCAALRAAGLLVPLDMRGQAFQKFTATYEALHQQYYRPIADSRLLDGAVEGMVASLGDPFSDYFPPTGETEFQDTLSNAYVGIGVVVQQMKGLLTVQSVISGSPAAKAGLLPQDEILAVNGKSIRGMAASTAIQLITGPSGSLVRLTVQRPGVHQQVLHISLRRARLTAPEVFTKMLPHHIAYLQLSIVGADSAHQLIAAVQQLRRQGATRLVLDLRGNPGGYLEQAEQMANALVPKGKVVLQIKARSGPAEQVKSTGPGLSMPIAVLMDRGTASAAEILSAALHEEDGAPLVGTRSYGKGTAQTLTVFADGSGIKYTVAQWLTPSGAWINHVGLQPTVSVQLPAYASLPALDTAALPLRQNQVSAAVRTLQQTLRALGYAVDRADGYFDPSTTAMVERFQAQHGLAANGRVDTSTAAALQANLNRLVAASDTQLSAAERAVLALPQRGNR